MYGNDHGQFTDATKVGPGIACLGDLVSLCFHNRLKESNMKFRALVLSSIFLSVSAAVAPVKVVAHSGGTDKNGCHGGSQAYHCHSGSDSDANKYYRMALKHGDEKDTMYTSKRAKVVTYSNCKQLNKKYPAGVAVSSSKAWTMFMKTSRILYKANKKLDLNKNGVVCGALDPESQVSKTISCVDGPMPPQTTSTTTSTSSTVVTTTTTLPASYYKIFPTTTTLPVSQRLVPCGSVGEIKDNYWNFQVLSVSTDSDEAIQMTMSDAEPALPGRTYVVATMRATNMSTRSRNPDLVMMKAVGRSGHEYKNVEENDRCPGFLFSLDDIPAGKTAIHRICWSVTFEGVANLYMTPWAMGDNQPLMSLDPWTRQK